MSEKKVVGSTFNIPKLYPRNALSMGSQPEQTLAHEECCCTGVSRHVSTPERGPVFFVECGFKTWHPVCTRQRLIKDLKGPEKMIPATSLHPVKLTGFCFALVLLAHLLGINQTAHEQGERNEKLP
eukprot:214267-Amphidinium_carterae.1